MFYIYIDLFEQECQKKTKTSSLNSNLDLLSKETLFPKSHIQYLCSDLLLNWRRRNFCLKTTILLRMLYCVVTVCFLVQVNTSPSWTVENGYF